MTQTNSAQGKWTVERELRILTFVYFSWISHKDGAVWCKGLGLLRLGVSTGGSPRMTCHLNDVVLRRLQTKGTSMEDGSLKHDNLQGPNVMKAL